ncbi:TackOD1 domain-containing metal-binding protein [Persephonella sp.]
MLREDFIPVIVYDGISETIVKKGIPDKHLLGKLPFEVRGFLNTFDTVFISGSCEGGLKKVEEAGLIDEAVFIYLFSEDRNFVKKNLMQVRKNTKYALLPVFSHIETEDKADLLLDGIYRGFSGELVDSAAQIWNILFACDPIVYPENTPEFRKILYIRYLYSRGIEEERPYLNRLSKYAFSWYIAHTFLGVHEEGGEFDELELLRQMRVLQSEIADKTSLCPSCAHYNLIFKEVCPNCRSIRIEIKEFLHHYSCGYIGPIDEFIQGDKLVCPKCHEELKHIGVDYDKTMEQYYCSDCHSSFTEPDISITCANCSKEWKPEDVVTKYVYNYFITPYGKTVAAEGKLPLSLPEEVSKILGTVSYDVFRFFLNKYLGLVKRFPTHRFCLLGITLEINESVYSLQPVKLRKIIKSILEVIRDNLRETDVVSFVENKYILILLAESTDDGVLVVKNRIDKLITQIITKNNVEELIKFTTATVCVPSQEKPSEPEELINKLMQQL